MASVELRDCPVEPGFDPLSPEFLADPFVVMRSLALVDRPVFYAPSIGYYVITRYRDIEGIFSDPESYSAAAAQLPLVELDPEARQILLDGGVRPQPSMVSLDPPPHTRLRRPTARAFSARRTAEMEPRIRVILDQILDQIDPSEPFDLVSSLTFPLPASVVFSFMGVPEDDYAQLKVWCGYRAKLAWGRPEPEEQIEHARHMTAYCRYLRELVAAKALDRTDDFTGALLAIHDEQPEQLTHEEIASILFSLSFAGHETTNYLIGNVLRRLLEEPSRWKAVVSSPALAAAAIEETLRYDPSVPVWRRITKCPVTIAGVDIPEGAKLFLWLAAAGRDPDVFPNPDLFDLHRAGAKHHLAFGKGIHFCIGSALGKLEARLALEALTKRLPRLRLVPDQKLTFHPNISFRGPSHSGSNRASRAGQISERAAAAVAGLSATRVARSPGAPLPEGFELRPHDARVKLICGGERRKAAVRASVQTERTTASLSQRRFDPTDRMERAHAIVIQLRPRIRGCPRDNAGAACSLRAGHCRSGSALQRAAT